MSKVLMDNGGLNGCLRGPQGVSAWWKETAQAHVFVLSRSFLLNYLEPNYKASKTKLLLLTMPIGIVEYAFTLLWDNLRWKKSIQCTLWAYLWVKFILWFINTNKVPNCRVAPSHNYKKIYNSKSIPGINSRNYNVAGDV